MGRRGLAAALAGLCLAGVAVARGGGGQIRAWPAQDWPTTGGAFDAQYYSPLAQIDTRNVGRLGLAWSIDLPGEQTLESAPLVVGGILYFTGQMSKVYAVDGASGRLLWTYDPESYKYRVANQRSHFPVNRGVGYSNGRLFVGTRDGRLIAIDARSGKMLWSRQTVDEASRMYISGAPLAYKDKVVIGNGGGDYGERGYLTAYDAKTGRQTWRFHVAPGDPAKGHESDAMAMAAKTWSGEYWKRGTGGGPWNGFTYDPELDRVYIGTGNSGPYDPEARSPGGGDNLFLSSIVAVDADTGRYIWHYQVNPREAWDFKATMNIILARLTIGGRERRVLMQSPTNGFFYVIDRDTGKLLSAEKTGKVTWAERIDIATGRPVEAPNIRYADGPVTFWPSPFGTHNWQPMAFSPRTGLVYIPTIKLAARYARSPNALFEGGGTEFTLLKVDADDATGALIAWDPVAQKPRWSVRQGDLWNGGVLATGGDLVFQGDFDGYFNAFDGRSGRRLWRFDAKLGIIAAPTSYSIGGRHYVSVLVGYGGSTQSLALFTRAGWKYGAQPRRLLTFALDGRAKLPWTAPRDFTVTPIDDPALAIDQAAADRGARLYNNKGCVVCHGFNGRSSGAPAPDLQESGIAADPAALAELLHGGALAENGMPRFEELTTAEIGDLHMYVRRIARETATGKPVAPPAPSGKF
ncbi:PQQ-dependent dehydrogenase, methanol/ethanol family [Sphingobium amiense]|uniref:PQQ-dependent dehydrogenase, methanol/ethanol family n=1 Tax=Sphingobium amiense TaxID=135719 RepID=A0A494WCB7_9SPHN|nr:PQQ-dependent dehydrogenase, methanol/ethanol family [Sphingobium amiense]BBD98430.1 PQQ-dependent dehydrogenase, methanol/ethanol family [Sphingobium amiense]